MNEEQLVRLTVFLRHDQSMSLTEIDEILYRQGFWSTFPPEDAEIVSWQVMMGIGQVVTLQLPPEKIRQVNLAIERSAWGAFRTEFYVTYDFLPVLEKKRTEAKRREEQR